MQNIFLIGMPSSGKSTLGKGLAKALQYHFFDMDKVIEEMEQMSVAEIFANRGEGYFRKLEHKILKTLPPRSHLVVSTGGGVPCFNNNMDIIRERGISVFLDLSPEILAKRMLASKKNDRPLIATNDPQLIENLRIRYESRLQFYGQADIRIVGDTDTESLLLEVTKLL